MVATEELEKLFTRDLRRLQKIIATFPSEKLIWQKHTGISNSCGHLTLHICGNLRHFIGHVLGDTDYIRNRALEFNSEPVHSTALIELISVATLELQSTMIALNADDLSKRYPIQVFQTEMTTGQFLYHLYGHLNYHMGQVDYLKRIVCSAP